MAKNNSINVRIGNDVKQTFIERCGGMGREYQNMLREMIEAFNEGRLRIKQTESQKQSTEELYE